jgi:hypothetical protein
MLTYNSICAPGISQYTQDSTEHEFPFLEEVYTPLEMAHKIEYAISLCSSQNHPDD